MAYRFSIVLIVAALACSACEREPVSPDTPDTIPPIPPAGLRVEKAQDGYITISWLHGHERDLFLYIVYRSTSATGAFAAIDSTRYDFYIDEQRAYDTLYYYYVTALDESGNESVPSVTVHSDSPNLNAPQTPDPPTILSVQQNGVRVMRLSWIPEDDSDIDGYAVYRSFDADFTADASSQIGFTEVTYFDDSSAVETGDVYYYRIRAFDNGGFMSDPSAVVWQVHLAAPVLIAPADWASIQGLPLFQWEPVPHAVEYELQIFETPGDVFANVIQVEAPATNDPIEARYFGPALQQGRVYYWRVVTFSKKREYPNTASETRAFLVL